MRKIKRFVLNDSFTVLSAEAQKNVLGGETTFKYHCVCEDGIGSWSTNSRGSGRIYVPEYCDGSGYAQCCSM